MVQFALGTVFGIVIATIGVSGIATVADKGIEQTKVVVQEAAKK